MVGPGVRRAVRAACRRSWPRLQRAAPWDPGTRLALERLLDAPRTGSGCGRQRPAEGRRPPVPGLAAHVWTSSGPTWARPWAHQDEDACYLHRPAPRTGILGRLPELTGAFGAGDAAFVGRRGGPDLAGAAKGRGDQGRGRASRAASWARVVVVSFFVEVRRATREAG